MIPFKYDEFKPFGPQRRDWFDKAVAYRMDDCILWPFNVNTMAWQSIKGIGYGAPIRFLCQAAHGVEPFGRPWPMADCEGGAQGCMNPLHVDWRSKTEKADIMRKRRDVEEGYPYE